VGARFGRLLKRHSRGLALLVSAGPSAPLETDIGIHPVDDLVGLAPECDS